MTEYAVTDPATGDVVATYPTATDAELDAALTAAAENSRTWPTDTTVADRAAQMRRVAQLHTEKREMLADIIVREMGKPRDEALGEIDFCAAIYEYYADNAEKFLADESIELLAGEGTAVIKRFPIGVLLGIMPWNFPYYQVARFACPNLLVGNTIVLKHAPQCPESAEALALLFAEAGLPAGAYLNIRATNEQVARLIADPRVAGVSFTGSERAGAAVAEIAGRNLKKCVLELGGSDPFLVLSSDDLDATVEAAAAARLDNTGQACNAAKRFIVVDELYDAFVEKFTATLLAAADGIAPLSSVRAAQTLEAQVAATPFWRAHGLSGTGFASRERICEVYDNTVAGHPHGTLVGFVAGEQAEETWALPDDQRRGAILESFAAYFGDEAKRPLAVYLSDWGTEEFTRGAYGASWSIGGLSRWGHLQNRPVGPIFFASSDIQGIGYMHVDGGVRIGTDTANRINSALLAPVNG
ncbi:succinate-semialdehyde dehydrogenase [NADP(+)] [Mycobacteroides abscessus]|nr:succinate-semialdehyde dehydrogenase [NADP(+)] [Mycobacteroides abscessus]